MKVESDHTPEASTSADAQGDTNLTQPKGSGEQPTSVERELKLKIVDMVNQFDEPCRRQDNTHISDYDGLDDAIYKLVAEERRQAKIPVYSWLGVWRDKLPPEAVTQLQDILGEGENTSEPTRD